MITQGCGITKVTYTHRPRKAKRRRRAAPQINFSRRPSVYGMTGGNYSSLFVTKKVQRRTLASGTYPNALPLVLPSAALGVVRAPPPVTVALRTRPPPVMP